MWLTNFIFENRVIENEVLELSDKDGLYFLGDHLTLRHCTLVLRVPTRRLHIKRSRFIDCTIEAKTPLKNCRWDTTHLKGCRFKGRFSGNDFGEWPKSPGQGSIEDCDFTEARLHQTRFLGCDVRTLRFPSWPCFTIIDSARRSHELSALPWPGKRGHLIGESFGDDPRATVAVTFEAGELAKWCGTTPEAIKAVLEKLDGVYY